jgi:hypothetical protein
MSELWALGAAEPCALRELRRICTQGDGTAAILANEPRAFTLSVHCQDNFPHRKQASDLDVGLAR